MIENPYRIILSYDNVDDVRDEDFTEDELVDRSEIIKDMTYNLVVNETIDGEFFISGGMGWRRSEINSANFSDRDHIERVRNTILSQLNSPSDLKVRVDIEVQKRIQGVLKFIREGVENSTTIMERTLEGIDGVDITDGDTILVKHKVPRTMSSNEYRWFSLTVVDGKPHIDKDREPHHTKSNAVEWAKENREGRILAIQDGKTIFIRKMVKGIRQYVNKWRIYSGPRNKRGIMMRGDCKVTFINQDGKLEASIFGAGEHCKPAEFDTREEAEEAIKNLPRGVLFGDLISDSVKVPIKKNKKQMIGS